MLEEALRHGHQPQVVLWSPTRSGERERALVESLDPAVEVHELPPRDLERVADARSPSGSLGIFALPGTSLAETRPAARTLILDGVSDPGNAGSLLRSAMAFGVQRVVAIGDSADPWQPKVVRATAGALFGLEVHRTESSELLDFLRRSAIPLLATAVDGERDRAALAPWAKRPCIAIAIGSEAHGVHEELLSRAKLRYAIAHSDRVESLNAAVAGSIVLHELHAAGP